MFPADLIEVIADYELLSAYPGALDEVNGVLVAELCSPVSLEGDSTDADEAAVLARWGNWTAASERWSLTSAQVKEIRTIQKSFKPPVPDPVKDRVDYGVSWEPPPLFDDEILLDRKCLETKPFAILGRPKPPPLPGVFAGLTRVHRGEYEELPGKDEEMKKLDKRPGAAEALDVGLSATRAQLVFLKDFIKVSKATSASSRGPITPTSLMQVDPDRSWLDFEYPELPRAPSPPIFARARPPSPPSQVDHSGLLSALLLPAGSLFPSSPRGKGMDMDTWNTIEGIQPFPFSSSAASEKPREPRPIWSSSLAGSPPSSAKSFEIDPILFPRVPKPAEHDDEDDIDMLHPDPFRPLSTSLNPDDEIDQLDSDSEAAPIPFLKRDLALLAHGNSAPTTAFIQTSSPSPPSPPLFRIPVPRLPTPPPDPPSHLHNPSLADLAEHSGTPWALKKATGLRSLTIDLPWTIWEPPGAAIWPVWEDAEREAEAPMRERARKQSEVFLSELRGTPERGDVGESSSYVRREMVEPEEEEEELVARCPFGTTVDTDVERQAELPADATAESGSEILTFEEKRHDSDFAASRAEELVLEEVVADATVAHSRSPSANLESTVQELGEGPIVMALDAPSMLDQHQHLGGQDESVVVDGATSRPNSLLVPQKRALDHSEAEDGRSDDTDIGTFVHPLGMDYLADESPTLDDDDEMGDAPAAPDEPAAALPTFDGALPASPSLEDPIPVKTTPPAPAHHSTPPLHPPSEPPSAPAATTPAVPPPKTRWSSNSALSRFIGSRGFQPPPSTVKKPRATRVPVAAPTLFPLAPPPLPRPSSIPIPAFLRQTVGTAPTEDTTTYRIIISSDLVQMPAHFQALLSAGFTLLDRPPRYSSLPHRTLEPHLVLPDGKTCVLFKPLTRIVGNVFRADELTNGNLTAPLTRDEAVFTTLHRLAGQYDRVLLVLEEKHVANEITRPFAYTPPVTLALASLESTLLERLPPGSKLLRSLDVVSDDDSCGWLLDTASKEERTLVEMSQDLNYVSAAAIVSHCSSINDFLSMSVSERQRTFVTVCDPERMARLSESLPPPAPAPQHQSSDESETSFRDPRGFDFDSELTSFEESARDRRMPGSEEWIDLP
ncbi:hypothetical protein RQP46_004551 [Phenoliferia psychrophenolica]